MKCDIRRIGDSVTNSISPYVLYYLNPKEKYILVVNRISVGLRQLLLLILFILAPSFW